MKKVFSFVLSLVFLCFLLALPSFAADTPRLVDDADLLSSSEEAKLISKLDRYSANYGMDIVIVTTYADLGYDIDAYAEYYYDSNGYSSDGILLLIGMAERDWVITATGNEGMNIFNSDAQEYISDSIYSALHNGYYADAFDTFADRSYKLIEDASEDRYYKAPFGWTGAIIAGLIAGLIIAAVYVGKLKSDLNTVSMQNNAANYVDRDSMDITNSRETFLYRNISKVLIQTDQSSSRSSSHSGSSHSSSHGKF